MDNLPGQIDPLLLSTFSTHLTNIITFEDWFELNLHCSSLDVHYLSEYVH